MDQKKLDQQSQHWEFSFSNNAEMFGLEPSLAAVKALKSFKEKNIKSIVELGAGLGRDTIFFAKNSVYVEALDYSETSVQSISSKSKKLNLTERRDLNIILSTINLLNFLRINLEGNRKR